MQGITSLDQYMSTYGALLGKQAHKSLRPLHIPGTHKLPEIGLLRKPFEAQAHVIAAGAKQLKRDRSVWLIAEMGTGKTLMAQGVVQVHAAGKPYRALVFCPGQLAKKWEREILETIPYARVVQLENWRDTIALDPTVPATVPTWYVITRDGAKLGAKWRPAVLPPHFGQVHLRCPECGGRLTEEDGSILGQGSLAKKRQTCEYLFNKDGAEPVEGCGAQLWQYTGELWKWEPARYIHKRLKGFFDYLILDEAHEEKSATTAQGNAAGALAAACKKVIPLTGTLIGGYAEHVRPLMFRISPRSLVDEGLEWGQSMKFSKLYGRVETVVRTKETDDRDGGDDNTQSRGSKRSSKTENIRPGIMPTLFGRHLIGQSVFLSLNEVADNLPPLIESVEPVDMDGELAECYKAIEEPLMDAIKEMMVKSHGKDKRLLGTMLQVLLAYPDYPFDWGQIGYYEGGEGGGQGSFIPVCWPENLDRDVVRPKEAKLIELVRNEVGQGRQVWVYVQYTDKRDVQERLQGLLEKEGLRVGGLRAAVSLSKREAWIEKNAPGLDVVISHPRLVETGLDLFSKKKGGHNFSTLIFYETGYNLFTLRQAARRSWRIGQKLDCKVMYLYYASTLQERCMSLMGKKLTAAQALEGKFSSEGLAAMAGDEGGSVEMALARSLAGRLDEGDAQRAWAKIASTAPEPAVILPISDKRREVVQRVLNFDFRRLKAQLARR